jgi:hypothetical protein
LAWLGQSEGVNSYVIREAAEGELLVRFVLDVAGSPERVEQLAKDLAESCERSGTRFLIARERPPADELGLYSGEHRI